MTWVRGILMCAFVVTLSFSSAAQDGRYFGAKGGYTLSNFWGDGVDNLNNAIRAGASSVDERNLPWFTVSLFAKKEVIPDFAAFQTEMIYYRGGKAWEGTYGGVSRHFQMQIDYIGMPWIVKIQLPVYLKPSIYAGPQLSLMFRSRANELPDEVETTPFFSGTNVNSEVFESYTNVVDLGFVAGVDFGIPFGPGDVVLDFRYQMGAVDVYNFAPARKIRNYMFMFMAGYALNFGGSM